jgi:hypothetical protein
MLPVRISADYWLRRLTYVKLLLNNRRRNVGKVPSNKFRHQFFKWPHASIYNPAVSRDGAAIAAIQICNDTGCARFSSMHGSNYSTTLHSPYLRTHWELPHSARRHLSHAINTLLLHVDVLLVQHGEGGYIRNIFFKAVFGTIIMLYYLSFTTPHE